MLAYSGAGRLEPRKVDLNLVVKETTGLLRNSVPETIRFELQLDKELPIIEADPVQIGQVVMNLVRNASEAIDGKEGLISVRTSTVQCDRSFLERTVLDHDLPEGEYVLLEVSDTGRGMDHGTMERVFDPFFTRKVTGRGLGLASVLGIIRAHKGTIMVESEPGRGTTFKALFPEAPRPD
jgi:signal transduction histidine kinase